MDRLHRYLRHLVVANCFALADLLLLGNLEACSGVCLLQKQACELSSPGPAGTSSQAQGLVGRDPCLPV
jgi:hypothetical protein